MNKEYKEPTLEEKYSTLQRLFREQNVVLDAIEAILQDKEPNDFELSYGIVRQAYDLKKENKRLEDQLDIYMDDFNDR